MLNLNGSLTKAGVEVLDALERGFHRRLSSRKQPATLAEQGHGQAQDRSRHAAGRTSRSRQAERKLGEALAAQLQREKAIMGVFDEGCMGMFNAIIPDDLLNPTGVFKERLSQSAPVLRDDAGQRRRGRAACGAGWKSAACKFITGPNRRRRI